MDFIKFFPSDSLKQYVRYYYVFKSDTGNVFKDTVFPCGDMEMIFNLGEGIWETTVKNEFQKTPQIELWGQITQPLQVKSSGKHSMFGIRFRTHAAGFFLTDELGKFNNMVSDATDIIGQPVSVLHEQLLGAKVHNMRIELVEQFLLKRLSANQKRAYQIDRVAGILSTINSTINENNMNGIAATHNMTSRNLNKLLNRYTGLSPKLVNKINRFQQSLRLIAKKDQSLTGIAYDCGYFDQSHFIREFKSFTGITPSAYLENTFTVNQVLQQF
jgi:AraC-like DNA-binding protein